jgi:TatD DNase family protein
VIVDTHCHLNFNFYKDDLLQVLKNARESGIERIIAPAIDIETSREVIELSQKYSEIFVAVGIHPNEANHFSPEDMNVLRILAGKEKVVAIGEIGLDNHHKDVDIETQVKVFKEHLNLAGELCLPVVVHNRNANQEILDCLSEWITGLRAQGSPLAINPGVLHAYNSDLIFAENAISLGFLVGAAGPVTFHNAIELQNVYRSIPPEKVVIETDAPFLTPHPFRGKRNEPANCVLIVRKLAELWQISEKEVEEITTNNASRIFRWKDLKQTNQ